MPENTGSFKPVRQSLTYSEILDRSSLPKSTGYRLVSILTNERLVFFDPERRTYRIGYRVLELAARGLNGFDLRQIAAPFLRKLGEATQENVLLAVRDGVETVYIDRVESTRSVRSSIGVGNRGPLYCTGLGKAILAFLPEEKRHALYDLMDFLPLTEKTITDAKILECELADIRKRGYAYDDAEHVPDIRCVAAPIRGQEDEIVGAISVSAPSSRADDAILERWVPLVCDAASQISREVGGPNACPV